MKKALLAALFLVIGIAANAQTYIDDLDEENLLGAWNVTSMTGTFSSFSSEDRNKTVKSIAFEDGSMTTISFTDGSYTIYKGFWVSVGRSDRYYIHMLPWNSGNWLVNFRVLQFHNNVLTLVSYDRMGTLYLTKQETNGISSAKADAPLNGKTYTLNGMEASDGASGIVIQNGKKTIRK